MDAAATACFNSVMTDAHERFLVFAAMRNEGPFIVEWVCWYRMLGFEVMIATNDCTDSSVALLDSLAEAGWITHITHEPGKKTPKRSAYAAARAHPLLTAVDWIFVCDVDEFLVLHRGDGTIQGFLQGQPRDFLGIAFNWQCFGNGKWKRYRDGLVHRTFRRAARRTTGPNRQFKSLFRAPEMFKDLGDHMPARFKGTWGEGANRWVNSGFETIQAVSDAGQEMIRRVDRDAVRHEEAQLNHYVVRSDESFDLKRGMPSASARRDRYTDTFHRMFNRNEVWDTSAKRYEAAFDAVHAQAMALPGVKRLHHLCCADYVERLCAVAGVAPEDDPRILDYLTKAAEA